MAHGVARQKHDFPAAFQTALDIHGGLLVSELVLLKIEGLENEDFSRVAQVVDTVVGPLTLPMVNKQWREGASEVGYTPGRTVSASIDGAYMRLFMRRTPGQWDAGNPTKLGQLLNEYQGMPKVNLAGELHYVCGKALGGGLTTISLRRFLNVNGREFRRLKVKLMVVAPDVSRYAKLLKAWPDVLAVSQYTLEQAKQDNVQGGMP